MNHRERKRKLKSKNNDKQLAHRKGNALLDFKNKILVGYQNKPIFKRTRFNKNNEHLNPFSLEEFLSIFAFYIGFAGVFLGAYISTFELICFIFLFLIGFAGMESIESGRIHVFIFVSSFIFVLFLRSNFEHYWIKYQGQNKQAVVLNTEWDYIYRKRSRRLYKRYLRVYFTENGKKVTTDVVDAYAGTFKEVKNIQLYPNPITATDTLQIRVAKWRDMYFTELINR